METLESLLKTKVRTRNNLEFIPDFRVNVQEDKGALRFSIHPFTHNGNTLNFVVRGNELIPHKGNL
jgi:hypothetical protein